MRTSIEVSAAPLTNTQWWNNHVSYSKFRRQGIDIICAAFVHPKAKANIILVTGLTESFLKYSEIIQYFYEKGFNVFSYDHQSQGLSGRCMIFIFEFFIFEFLLLFFFSYSIFSRVNRITVALGSYFRRLC